MELLLSASKIQKRLFRSFWLRTIFRFATPSLNSESETVPFLSVSMSSKNCSKVRFLLRIALVSFSKSFSSQSYLSLGRSSRICLNSAIPSSRFSPENPMILLRLIWSVCERSSA